MNGITSRLFLPAALVAVLATGAAAFAHEPKPEAMKPMAGHGMASNNAASMQMQKIMMPGKKMPMHMSGNVDKDFASMMIIHHQQAIDMAEIMLKRGSNAELKAMAAKMKTDQQAEIAKMAPYAK